MINVADSSNNNNNNTVYVLQGTFTMWSLFCVFGLKLRHTYWPILNTWLLWIPGIREVLLWCGGLDLETSSTTVYGMLKFYNCSICLRFETIQANTSLSEYLSHSNTNLIPVLFDTDVIVFGPSCQTLQHVSETLQTMMTTTTTTK